MHGMSAPFPDGNDRYPFCPKCGARFERAVRAGRERLVADRPSGMHHMLVNGTVVRRDECTIPAHAGRLLRPN